jgi:hypothetical protein
MKRFALAGLAVVVCVGLLFTFSSRELNVPSSATHQFSIEVPMERVRKVLVRTNAVKKIVAMADAKLLDQEWLQLEFEIDRPLLKRQWHVDGSGQLVVESSNAWLGTHELTLNQSVDIKPDRLYVENALDKPSGPIEKYSATLELVPDEAGNATVNSSLDLMISTRANWLAASSVRRGIKQAALKSLKDQEAAIREVVAEQADKLLVLPE